MGYMLLMPSRLITHDEARAIAQRLVNSHFGNGNEARASIPADPERDDDLLIMAYIEQRKDASFDLEQTLRAVIALWGPGGANKVTKHVLAAREARRSNDEIDALEAAFANLDS